MKPGDQSAQRPSQPAASGLFPATGERKRAGAGKVLAGLLLLICLAVFLLRALDLGFVSDDAFISLRYARNLAEGHGLVFNLGDRVEGYSNFLFVLLVAGLKRLTIDPLLAARGIGLAAGLLLVALTFGTTFRLASAYRVTFASLAALLVASNPYLAVWAPAGLETALYALLAMVAVIVAHNSRSGGRFALSSLVAGCVALLRPEGVIVYPAVIATALLGEAGSVRTRAQRLMPGLAIYSMVLAIFYSWRYGYYGEWLPNTYYVRSGFTSDHLARGTEYLAAFCSNISVLPILLLSVISLLSNARRSRVPFALLAATLIVGVIAVGGDGLPAYRFLVPVLAPVAVLAALGAEDLQVKLSERSRMLGRAVPALVLLLAALFWVPNQDAQWLMYEYQKRVEIPNWSSVGRWLEQSMPPDTTLAAVPIGAVSYYSRLSMIDLMGLTDRHIARSEKNRLGTGWAGHEKSDGAYVLRRRPDILLLGNIFVSEESTIDFASFPPYRNPSILAREEDIAFHPEFGREYRPMSFEIESGRYLHCFVRRAWVEDLWRDEPSSG